MHEKPFDKAIRVRLSPTGKVHTVRSTREAADFLGSIDWPGERGPLHRDATDACNKVLDGHRSTSDARNAFEAAAREAGMLVDDEEDAKAEGRMWFDRSIKVKQGANATVREVRSVKGASEVLIDWPHARRGPFYQSARETVESALKGEASAAQAREAFAALCDHAGVLVH